MKNILCFGDSNTWGYVGGTAARYEWGTRWTSILHDRMYEDGYYIIEEGVNGRTTVFPDPRPGRIASQVLPGILDTHSPLDLIIVMLGTNDCKPVFEPDAQKLSDGIDTIIRMIREHSPGLKILLVSPIGMGSEIYRYDKDFVPGSHLMAEKLPELYQSVAEKWAIEFMAASDYAQPGAGDQEHMDENGHRVLAEALEQKIRRILES